MSTDIPREIRWSPRPGRPQVVPSWSSYFSLFLGHFWKFFLYNRIAPQTQPIERMQWRRASVVTSRQRRHESLEQDGVNGVRVDFVFTHLAATAIYVKF